MSGEIVLCELLMPCQLFAQKCSNCQEINQNIKMFGVPPNTLPLVIYIMDNLLLGIITLQHVSQNNCQWVYWCLLMVWSTFWRSRKMLANLPKLSCGFKSVLTFHLWHDKFIIIMWCWLFLPSIQTSCLLTAWPIGLFHQLGGESGQSEPGFHLGGCRLWCVDGEHARQHILQKTRLSWSK